MYCDFFSTTLFLEKLLLYTFSEWLLRRNSYIFRAAIFSEQMLFSPFWDQSLFQSTFSVISRAKILQSSPFLRLRSSLWQFLFGTAVFSLFKIKISKRDFSEKLIFQKSNILHYLLFLESCFFRAATFSKDGTFYSSYLFRRATFLQHAFSEELLFHSCASFPQLHFLFIR